MSLLQGIQDIPDEADEVSVVFPEALPGVPDVVIAVVENTSGDPVKLAVKATVTQKGASGFTVGLSQETNSANYKLVWYVSDPATLVAFIQEVALKGRRVSDLNQTLVLSNDDYFPVVRAYPVPHTKRIKWGRIKQGLAASVIVPEEMTLADPDGGQWSLSVDTDGALITTEIV